MIPQRDIILCVIVALLAAGGITFAQETADPPVLNESMERHFTEGNFQKALAEGLPAYRRLVREKYDLPAIHAYARNLAIINRAAQETVLLLSRNNANAGNGNFLDAGAFYSSLVSLGRVKQFPSEGLTPQETEFLSLLHTATLRSCHQQVLQHVPEQAGASVQNYLFAYLLATREPERYDRLLDDLPPEFQTREMLRALAVYCASLDRKDVAAAVCMESGKRFAEEADAAAFCNSAADYYIALNDVAGAVAALKQIVSRFPQSDKAPETQLHVVALLEERWKSYGTAAKECQAFLEKFPNSDKAQEVKLRIGHLYYMDQDFERAIQYFDELAKDPKMAEMDVQRRFLLAFCYMGEGQSETAADLLNEIVAKHSDHPLAPRAQYVLAKSYLSRQQYELARTELERLLVLYPNSEFAAQAKDLLQRLSRVQDKKEGEKKPPPGAAPKKPVQK